MIAVDILEKGEIRAHRKDDLPERICRNGDIFVGCI